MPPPPPLVAACVWSSPFLSDDLVVVESADVAVAASTLLQHGIAALHDISGQAGVPHANAPASMPWLPAMRLLEILQPRA